MAKPGTKGLLKEILSANIELIYVYITEKATEWAIAGFIEEANNLLEKLWSFKIPHSADLWLTDEGLEVLWKMSGKQPLNRPFALKDISAIERENWSRVFYPYRDKASRDRIFSKSFQEFDGNDLLFKAIVSGFYNTEKIEDILDGLKKFMKTGDAIGYSYFLATSSAVLLATKNELHDEAEYFIKLWGEGYQKYWSNYMLPYLMRDRKAAAYLLSGVLAPVFKLTKEKIQSETNEIIDALSTRMIKGRTLVYGNLSWHQLLDNISKIALEQETIKFPENILNAKSLKHPSATDEKIMETEKRLNIRFPDDYRKFLIASNGFESFSQTGVTLATVEKVDFLEKVDADLVEIWVDNKRDFDPTFADKFRSSIIIGGFKEEQQLLLIPLQNNKWECWYFSSWGGGEVIYESFRFYMEGELQKLEDEFYVH